ACCAREALLLLERLLEIAFDAGPNLCRAGADGEELRPELVDQGEMDPVLQLRERVPAVGARQRAGRGLDALVQLHRQLLACFERRRGRRRRLDPPSPLLPFPLPLPLTAAATSSFCR